MADSNVGPDAEGPLEQIRLEHRSAQFARDVTLGLRDDRNSSVLAPDGDVRHHAQLPFVETVGDAQDRGQHLDAVLVHRRQRA